MNHALLITGFATNVLFIQLNNAVKGREQLIARIHYFANSVTDTHRDQAARGKSVMVQPIHLLNASFKNYFFFGETAR